MRNVELSSGIWTEITIPVLKSADSKNYANLETHYENWKSQLVWILAVNNSDKTFPLTVYIDDIYATKSVEIAKNGSAETEYAVGETAQAESFFTYDKNTYSAGYFISDEYGLRRYLSDGEDFLFTHNGTYTVSANIQGENARGSASVEISVTDSLEGKTNGFVKRTATSQTVNVTELFGSLTYNGVTLTPTLYSAKYLDTDSVPVSDNTFTADKDGYYTCLMKADYQAFGTTCTTYQTFTVDVYDEEAPFAFIDETTTESLKAQIFHTKTVVGVEEKETLGLQGDFYRVTGSQSGDAVSWARVGLKLLHSEAYYEEMLKEDWKISYDVYLLPDGVTDDSISYEIRFGTAQTATTYRSNTLLTIEYSLDELLSINDPYVGKRLFIIMSSTGGIAKHYAYVGNFRFEKAEKTETENSQNDFFEIKNN